MMTEQEKEALLIEVHRYIEDAATRTAAALRAGSVGILYPPNGGLTDAEQAALASLTVTPDLESALRKVIADAASIPLFHFFCLLDGVGTPQEYDGGWIGLALSRPNEDEDQGDFLHDEFNDTYWTWRKVRPDPGWKLDTYED
ncbi:MAG TPA: hypothetical protein VD861_21865 [Pyrinomonadaceae bacterium]|nr:hypothetical protein [Pyrinomonadaceae bacterium]